MALGMAAAQDAGGAEPGSDVERGAQAFGSACGACHSVRPGENMTGPTLGEVWGRKAGTADKFIRYSKALAKSGITWNEQTLDQWLANPAALVPGNAMAFPGMADPITRHNIIAFLRAVSEGTATAAAPESGGGMMAGRRMNLKQAPADAQVVALSHCRDTYVVTTASGATRRIGEYSLRLKIDSSDYGPNPGKPVILASGTRGDMASVVFAAPAEVGSFIRESCQ